MSSYQSQPYQIQQPQESVNTQLVGTVLNTLQTRYDSNKSIVEQTIAKYEMLKGLSDSDNEYIASRVKEAESAIQNYGKKNGDLSMSTTRDTMLSALKGVYSDPIVQNAVQNKAVYDNFNAEVSKLKEKDGGKYYSNVNYQDALEQAGVDKYLKGEVKKLGSLKYEEYVNLPEKYNKIAEDYAKEMGFEKIIDSTGNMYYDQYTKGKVVTQEEIYKRLESQLDEKDKSQLRINARQSLGKLSKDELGSIAEPELLQRINLTKEQKSQIEARLSTETDKSKIEDLNLQLVNASDRLTNYSKQKEAKNYNIYDIYQQKFITGVSGSHDIQAITDIKRDTTKLDILKFEFDQVKDERNYRLKEREVIAKELDTKLKKQEVNALTAPTEIQVPKDLAQEQKTSEQILNESLKTDDASLDAYLKKSNENNYNSKSPTEQWAYKTALKTGDPTMPLEKQNLIKSFNNSLEGKVQIVNATNKLLKERTSEMFNGITGAKLENLAGELPYTVAVLRQGKKFEELDGNQQKAIMLEMGSNVAKHMATGREKSILMSGLTAIDIQLKSHPSDKVKSIYNVVEESFKKTTKLPSISSIGFGGMKGGVLFMPTFITSASPLQDTDVTELEKDAGDANVDGETIFGEKGLLGDLKLKTTEIADKYKPNLSSNKAIAWSTQNKYQSAEAIRLQQTIQANFPEIVMPDSNNFIVNRQGAGFNITFDEKDAKGKPVRVTKYVERLAEGTMEKFNLQEQKWHSSFENSSVILPQFSFSPKMRIESMNTFKKIAENRPDIIPTDMYVEVHNRGSLVGTEFQSDEDIADWVQSQPNVTEEKQQKISNILNSTYVTDFEVKNGQLLGKINIISPDKKENSILIISNQTELDEGKLYIESLQKINEFKSREITKILNK